MPNTPPPAPTVLTEAEIVQIRASAVRWDDLQLKPIAPLLNGQVPDMAHDTLALEMGELAWNKNARFWAERKQFLFWNGARWEVDEKLKSYTYTRAFLRLKAKLISQWAEKKATETNDEKTAKKLLDWADRTGKELMNRATVSAVREMMMSNPDKVVVTNDLDSDPWLLGTPSGVVDLRTGAHRSADPTELITKSVAVNPAPPGITAPMWQEFLHVVMDGDAELISFLQRMLGYTLTGLVDEHKLAFLYGSGRNGKGVFWNTAMNLMADYGRKAPNSLFLESKNPEHSTNLAGLAGARLAVGSEINEGSFWNETSIKDATGGDVLTARFMHGNYFDFMPSFFLMIAGNSKPVLRDTGPSIRERMMLIPFTVQIPREKRDTKLAEKLEGEWPAILRWVLDGCLEWQRIGLAVPESIKAASETYVDAEDFLGQFIAENCEVKLDDPHCGVPKDDFLRRYNLWRSNEGLQNLPKVKVTKELERRGHGDGKIRIGDMTREQSPVWC